jgi:hypothetical protein
MARWAGWLFAASGVLAFVGLLMPADDPRSVPAVAVLGCAGLLVAAAIAVLPARWWDVRRLTGLALLALVLCSVFALSGAVPAFGYPTFFLILFAWVGLALPRGTELRLALRAAIAYALPPVLRDAAPALVSSVVVAVPLMVLLAETAASVVSRLDRLNSALLTAATSDDLTGVGNRRRADELLRELAPGDRDHDRHRPLQAGQRPARSRRRRRRARLAGRPAARGDPRRRRGARRGRSGGGDGRGRRPRLYEAKRAGRDRIHVAGPAAPPAPAR